MSSFRSVLRFVSEHQLESAVTAVCFVVVFWAVFMPYIAVPEGSVAVVSFFGAYQHHALSPGFHLAVPIVLRAFFGTEYQVFNTRPEVDTFENVECFSADRHKVYWPKLVVVNRMLPQHARDLVAKYGSPARIEDICIKKPSHEEITAFCSMYTAAEIMNHATIGELNLRLQTKLQSQECVRTDHLNVTDVRIVDPPRYNEAITRNYEDIQKVKTELTLQEEKNKKAKTEQDGLRQAELHNLSVKEDSKLSEIRMAELEVVGRIERQRIEKEHERSMRILEEQTALEAAAIRANATKITAEAESFARNLETQRLLQLHSSEGYNQVELARNTFRHSPHVMWGLKPPAWLGGGGDGGGGGGGGGVDLSTFATAKVAAATEPLLEKQQHLDLI